MRHRAVVLAALLLLGGCASGSLRTQGAADAEGAAAPGPDLVGTWRGMAWAKGEPQATGRVRIQGDRVKPSSPAR